MSKIMNAAKLYSGRSRMCEKCSHHPCSEAMFDVCNNAFVHGFGKGVFWLKAERRKAKEKKQ